jgi:YD repeat-containing protein
MTAVITSADSGLFGSQRYQGQPGLPGGTALGHRLNTDAVNLVNGNLVMQRQDQLVMAKGLDMLQLLSYNSQGQSDHLAGHGWLVSSSRKLSSLPAQHQAGSSIIRHNGDGSQSTYTFDVSRQLYVSTAGDGRHDTLTFDAASQQWRWQGDGRDTERYDLTGRLVAIQDGDGNQLSLTYLNGLLSSIVDGSGQKTQFDYIDHAAGKRIAQIRTLAANGTALRTDVRYDYDSMGRLERVSYDLTPDDHSISDGRVFRSTYSYDGSSQRIARVSHSDGSSIAYTYKQYQGPAGSFIQQGAWLVDTVTDALGRTIRLQYDAASRNTDVTDSAGQTTSYRFDGKGLLSAIITPPVNGTRQTTQFFYDAQDNLIRKQDALGRDSHYQYDSRGQLTQSIDPQGRRVDRRFDTAGNLVAEISYLELDPDGIGAASASTPQVSRKIYDALQRLQYDISASGEVKSYHYDAAGQLQEVRAYSAQKYPLASLAASADLTQSQLNTFVAAQAAASLVTTRYSYDARGQLQKTEQLATAAPALSETYVYSAQGLLLSKTNNANQTTSYQYDGLGRLLSSQNALNELTTVLYDDAGSKVVTQYSSGKTVTKVLNRNGDVIEQSDSSATHVAQNRQRLIYDQRGLLRVAEAADGSRTYYFYDAVGQQTGVIDGRGQLTRHWYDAAGQQVMSRTYQQLADPRTLLQSNGQLNEALWDLERFSQSSQTDNISYRIYDLSGLLRFAVNAAGAVTEYHYDGRGVQVHQVTYHDAVDVRRLTPGMSENKLIALLYRLPSADVSNTELVKGRDPIQPYPYQNNARVQQRYLDTQQLAVSKTGGYVERSPNQPYPYQPVSFQSTYLAKDAIMAGTQQRLADGRQRLSWPATEPRFSSVEVGYRILNNNDDYQFLPLQSVQLVAGNYQVDLPALERPEYDITLIYRDQYGRPQAESRVGITQILPNQAQSKAIQFRNYAAYWAISQQAGSSLQQVIPPAQWSQIAKVTATVYENTGSAVQANPSGLRFVSSAETLAEAFPSYQGQVNLSIGQPLANAKYQVHLTVHYKDGQQQSSAPFLYEIGSQQSGALTQTLRWSQQALPAGGTVHQARYRSAYRNTGWTETTVQLLNGQYQLTLNGLTENEYYEVEVSHQRGSLTHQQQQEQRLSSTFVFLANAQDTVIDARSEQLKISEYQTQGSSLRGVFSQTQANALDYVIADVYDQVSGKLISSAYTYLSAYSSYQGEINLSTDKMLADGRYRVRLSSFHRNGSTSQQEFQYEIGKQLERSRPSSVKLTLDDLPANADVYYWFPQFTDQQLVKATVDSNGQVLIQLNDLYAYDRSRIPDGLYDLFVHYQDKTTGELLKRYFTQVNVSVDQHDAVLTNFDRPLVPPTGVHQHRYQDEQGRLLGEVDGNGILTSYSYNGAGQLIRKTQHASSTGYGTDRSTEDFPAMLARAGSSGDDKVEHYVYDAYGRRQLQIDAAGYVTTYAYNSAGQLNVQTRYDRVINYSGQPVAAILTSLAGAASQRSEMTYDALGRLVRQSDSQGLVTEHSYDKGGNTVSTTRLDSRRNQYQQGSQQRFDALGRLTAELDAVAAEKLRTAANSTAAEVVWQQFATFYEYDQAGRLRHRYQQQAQIKNTAGAAVGSRQIDQWLYYNDQGQLSYVVDELGTVTGYSYDNFGRQSQIRRYAQPIQTSGLTGQEAASLIQQRLTLSAADLIQTSQYDVLGRLSSSTDQFGLTNSFSYNSFNQLIQQFRPDQPGSQQGLLKSFSYDGRGAVLAEQISAGGQLSKTERRYDSFGRLIEQKEATGQRLTFEYDALGRQIALTDIAMQRSTSSYDAFGRVLQQRDVLGQLTEFRYDDSQNKITIRHPDGTEQQQFLTAFGQTLQLKDALGNSSRMSFDAAGRPVKTELLNAQDQVLQSSLQRFNEQGLLAETTSSAGVLTRYYYDAAKQLVERVDDATGLAYKTQYKYDALGRQLEVISADGTVTRQLYNAKGQLQEQQINATGEPRHSSKFEYDSRGNKVKVQSVAQNGSIVQTTVYSYDSRDRLISKTEDAGGLNRLHQYQYDAAGQLIFSQTPDGLQQFQVYDNRGLLRYQISGTGQVTEYLYDAKGQKTEQIHYARAISVSNLAAQLAQSADQPGLIAQRLLDRSWADPRTGQIVGQQNELNDHLRLFFDNRGRELFRLTAAGELTQFYYDAAGRLSSQRSYLTRLDPQLLRDAGQLLTSASISAFLSANTALPAATQRFVYNALNQRLMSIDALGYVTQYSYDAAGLLSSTLQYRQPVSLNQSNLSQALTSADVVLQVHAEDRLTQQLYDALGRLRFSINAAGEVSESRYSPAGQLSASLQYQLRVSGRFTTVAALQTALGSAAAVQQLSWYDALGQKVFEQDAAGYLTAHSYDDLGRLTQSERSSQPQSLPAAYSLAQVQSSWQGITAAVRANHSLTRYGYNALGQQISKDNGRGRQELTHYNNLGRVEYQQDVAGNRTYLAYNAQGLLSRKLIPVSATMGRLISYDYDERGLLVSEKEYMTPLALKNAQQQYLTAEQVQPVLKNGVGGDRETRYSYDSLQRMVRKEVVLVAGSSDLLVTEYSYNSFGQIEEQIEASGSSVERRSRFVYDQAGRMLRQIQAADQPEQQITAFVYNAFGQQLQQIDGRGVALAESDSSWALAQRFQLGYITGTGAGQRALLAAELTTTQQNQLKAIYTEVKTYDAAGRISSVSRGGSLVSRSEYNSQGDLVSFSNGAAQASLMFYDGLHRLVYAIDATGAVSFYQYNERGDIVSKQRYQQKLSSGSYHSSMTLQQVAQLVAARPGQSSYLTQYQFDLQGMLVAETDATGAVQRFEYDVAGNMTAAIDKNGNKTEYLYNQQNKLIELKTPKHQVVTNASNRTSVEMQVVTKYEYDVLGQKIAEIKAAGSSLQNTTRYEYDNLGREIKVSYEARLVANGTQGAQKNVTPTESKTYDLAGNLLAKTDNLGRTEIRRYDALNRLILLVDSADTLRTFHYDQAGNQHAERLYQVKVATYKDNDAFLQQLIASTPYHEQQQSFNAANQLISKSSSPALYYNTGTGFQQSTNVSRIFYNQAGLESKTTDGRGISNFTFYDAAGRPVLTINGDGYASYRELDANGNNIRETVYAKALTSAQLNQLSTDTALATVIGMLQSSADNRVSHFRYDAMNRLLEQQVRNVTVHTVSGSTATAVQADVTTRYQYDEQGNVVLSEYGAISNGNWLAGKVSNSIVYDSLHRQLKKIDSGFTNYKNVAVTPTQLFGYDAQNRLVLEVREHEDGTAGVIDELDRITTNIYDKAGRLTQMTASGGIDIRYVYDQYNNIIVKKELQNYQTYDAVSKTASSSTRWLQDVYFYDSANRQTMHTNAEGFTETTRYDFAGRVLAKGLQNLEHQFYEYDVAGRLVFSNQQGKHQRFFYDESGNLSLQVSSTGVSLQQRELSWLLAADRLADGFQFKVFRFDGRQNAIESLEPELDYLRAQASQAPATGTAPNSNFTAGAASVAMGGDVSVGFHLMASGSKQYQPEQTLKQYGIEFNFAGMTGYNGKVKMEWDTGFAGAASRGSSEIDLSKQSRLFQGINSTSESIGNNSRDFNRYGVTATGKTTTSNIKTRGFVYQVHLYKQNAQGDWEFYKTVRGTYGWEGAAPAIDQFNARSKPQDQFSLPSLVTLTGQPASATRLTFYTRPLGSNAVFSSTVGYYSQNGRFEVDVSSLGQGQFEYYYEATDSAGVVVNGAKGTLTTGANSSISHQNTSKAGRSLQSLATLAGKNLTELRAYGSSKQQSYNAFGQIQQTVDGRGYLTSFSYNQLGQLIARTDPQTTVVSLTGQSSRITPKTQYQYDANGNQIRELDANGHSTLREFSAGRISRILHADGSAQTFSYDSFGELRQERTKDSRLVNYSYDQLGNVVLVDRTGRNDDRYLYNQQGQKLQHSTGYKNVATGLNNILYYDYDKLGRILLAVDEAGQQTRYQYAYDHLIGHGGGWTTTTEYASGDRIKEQHDLHNRLVWRQDMGQNTYIYSYDQAAGWLSKQTGSNGQDIRYAYYSNGLRKQIDDLAARNNATFNYDAQGNLIREDYYYHDNSGQTLYSQRTRASFDELNRLSQVVDQGVDIQYSYDAVGNRRRILTNFIQVNNQSATQDYWYSYDSMNRVQISKGSLLNGQVARGDGVSITYDSGGRRKTVTNAGGSVETYTYDAFGWLVRVDVDGQKRVERSYYDGGYLKSVKEYKTVTVPEVRYREYRNGRYENLSEPYDYAPAGTVTQLATESLYTYNAAGQKLTEQTKKYDNNTNNENINVSYVVDALGNMLSSSTSSSVLSNGQWSTTTQQSRFSYLKMDSYKQKSIEVTATLNGQVRYQWDKGLSQMEYDVNGNLLRAVDSYAGRMLSYINSYDGKVLTRTEESPQALKKHRYFYFNGNGIGDIGDDGPSYRDYASVLADAERKAQQNQQSKEQEYKPVFSADFDANFLPVDRQSGVTSGRYTVRRGDTLQTIAAALWGDKSLWYMLADANGLQGTEALANGTTLSLPNLASTNLHHSSETFRPYNPGQALGDINPTLPEVPPPPIPPAKKAGCGGVAMIVMAVVAVVATVVTAGAAALAMGAVTAGSATGMAAAWAAGMTVMTGGVAMGVGVAAAAFAGGFVGSVASQLVGKAMGVVESFSLRQAVAGGLTSMASVGVARSLQGVKAFSETAGELTRAGKIMQAGLSVPVNAGLNQMAGIDTSFSWGNVAVSMLSQAAMTSQAMEGALQHFALPGDTAAQAFNPVNVLNGTMAGMAGAATGYVLGKALLKGSQRPSWNFGHALRDAFGGALGEEIKRSATPKVAVEAAVETAEEAAVAPQQSAANPDVTEDAAQAAPASQIRAVEEPVQAEATATGPDSYQVKRGDSLEKIARQKYGDNWRAGITALKEANNIHKTDAKGNPIIGIGKELIVPDLSQLTPETLRAASREGGRIVSRNQAQSDAYQARMALEQRQQENAALLADLFASGGFAANEQGGALQPAEFIFGSQNGAGGTPLAGKSDSGYFAFMAGQEDKALKEGSFARYLFARTGSAVGSMAQDAWNVTKAGISSPWESLKGVGKGVVNLGPNAFNGAVNTVKMAADGWSLLLEATPWVGEGSFKGFRDSQPYNIDLLMPTTNDAQRFGSFGTELLGGGVLTRFGKAGVVGKVDVDLRATSSSAVAADAGLSANKARILANIAESRAARESSGFSDFIKAEGKIQEELQIWPPNRGRLGPVSVIELQPGTLIDRYGPPRGSFVAPQGSSFAERALPSYYENSVPFFKYEVIKPIPNTVQSKVLPWFGQKGLGTQYELEKSVQWYLDNKFLRKND